jgi:hypothetical protein
VHAPAHTSTQRPLIGARTISARTLAARSNAPQPREVMMNASANREFVPEFRTLVFIETTQFVTGDSSVWSVQVWRVTLLSTQLNRSAKVPVANSI